MNLTWKMPDLYSPEVLPIATETWHSRLVWLTSVK